MPRQFYMKPGRPTLDAPAINGGHIMHVRMAALAAVSLACVACWPGPSGVARAETALPIPQSERVESEGVLDTLREIAKRGTPTGAAAQKVLDLLTPHIAQEEEFILPPLVLLPALANEVPAPDMRWAIPLAERVKAEHAALEQTHKALKAAFVALQDAAKAEGDRTTAGFAGDLIADDLGDQEIIEPAVIVIGDYLRSQLPAQ